MAKPTQYFLSIFSLQRKREIPFRLRVLIVDHHDEEPPLRTRLESGLPEIDVNAQRLKRLAHVIFEVGSQFKGLHIAEMITR